MYCLLSFNIYFDGLVQERRNYIANALELRHSCTKPFVIRCTPPANWRCKGMDQSYSWFTLWHDTVQYLACYWFSYWHSQVRMWTVEDHRLHTKLVLAETIQQRNGTVHLKKSTWFVLGGTCCELPVVPVAFIRILQDYLIDIGTMVSLLMHVCVTRPQWVNICHGKKFKRNLSMPLTQDTSVKY